MLKIAVADDDFTICAQIDAFLRQFFLSSRYKLNDYSDGAELIKDINDNVHYDIIFLDIRDPNVIDRVKNEIFTNNIYVYSLNGEIYELPYGATVIDFAYKIHTDIGNHLYKAYVNGKEVKLTRLLNNKDRIFSVLIERR